MFIRFSSDDPTSLVSDLNRTRRMLIAGALVTVCLLGCTSSRFRLPDSFGRRSGPDVVDFETLSQRIDSLRDLGKRAHSMSQPEQDKVSEQLVRVVQTETHPQVRVEAVRALGEFPTRTAFQGLTAASRDPRAEIRIETCHALARRGSDGALRVLTEVLNSDTDVDVRMAAVKGLSQSDKPQAVAALGSCLDDSDPALQYLAMQSLKEVTGTDHGGDVRRWKEVVQFYGTGAGSEAATIAAERRPSAR